MQVHCGMMRFAVSVALLSTSAASRPVGAEQAHFWISSSNTDPSGPEAPTVIGIQGAVRNLYVWAQPATMNSGAYDANTNPFKQLRNISLNLVTTQPVVDFLDDAIVVYNPMLDVTTRRFQFVFDSTDELASDANLQKVLDGTPDRIRGMQGYSLVDSGGEFSGIGPTCHLNDPHCAITNSGIPAWLVASVAFQTVQSSGSAEHFLQIGNNGMNHAGESSSATMVVFGAAGDPIYDASTDRGMTFGDDNPDFVVQAFPPPPGDYNLNGAVDAADYTVWRDNLGAPAGTLPADVDGGVIGQPQYDTWKTNFGTTVGSGSLTSGTVPEPATLAMLIMALLAMFVRRRTAVL